MRTAQAFVARHRILIAALFLSLLPGCPDNYRSVLGIFG